MMMHNPILKDWVGINRNIKKEKHKPKKSVREMAQELIKLSEISQMGKLTKDDLNRHNFLKKLFIFKQPIYWKILQHEIYKEYGGMNNVHASAEIFVEGFKRGRD